MRDALHESVSWLAALAVIAMLVGMPVGASAEQVLLTATDVAEDAFSDESGDIHSGGDDDSLFPLWKDLAKGHDLPPPYGVSVNAAYMGTEYGFGPVKLALGDDPLLEYDLTSSGVTYQTYTTGMKADLWLLPFMNVMALSGYTDVDVLVTLHDIPVGYGGIPPEVEIGDKILELHFQGPYYGFGTVLAVGWRGFFATSDFVWTSQVLEAQVEGQDDDTVNAFSLAPRFGHRTGTSEVWAGARYITSDRRFSGSAGELSYDLEVHETEWNFLAGAHVLMYDHWDFTVEGGMGDREMIVVNAGYRW